MARRVPVARIFKSSFVAPWNLKKRLLAPPSKIPVRIRIASITPRNPTSPLKLTIWEGLAAPRMYLGPDPLTRAQVVPSKRSPMHHMQGPPGMRVDMPINRRDAPFGQTDFQSTFQFRCRRTGLGISSRSSVALFEHEMCRHNQSGRPLA